MQCSRIFVSFFVSVMVQIHANCRIRRVYFSDRLYSEDELPAEFKLYLPVQNKAPATKVRSRVNQVGVNYCNLHVASTSCSAATGSAATACSGCCTALALAPPTTC